jgi:hypothetical protein
MRGRARVVYRHGHIHVQDVDRFARPSPNQNLVRKAEAGSPIGSLRKSEMPIKLLQNLD